MKIKKIVVDELPKRCSECVLVTAREVQNYTLGNISTVVYYCKPLGYMVTENEERCPLVKECESK